MNGRAYDYNTGRFLSVDPFIQSPWNSQSVNPYSYIMNNPLSGIDPTGYSSICKGDASTCPPDNYDGTNPADEDGPGGQCKSSGCSDSSDSNGEENNNNGERQSSSGDQGKPKEDNTQRHEFVCDKKCQEDAQGSAGGSVGIGGLFLVGLALVEPTPIGEILLFGTGAAVIMSTPGDTDQQANMRGASESSGRDPNDDDEDDFNEEDIIEVKVEISRRGKPQITVRMKDGSVRIISRDRTKIDLPEPRAAKGLRPKKFNNSLPGSKGKKRLPTKKELQLLDKHTKR